MTIRLPSGLVLVALCATAAAGWEKEARSLRGGDFPPPPEKVTARYVFGWSGIEAAEAEVRLQHEGGDRWTAEVRGGTRGGARALWKLDAEYDAVVSGADWRSVSAKLTESYRHFRAEEKMEFRPGGVRSLRSTTKPGATPGDWTNFYVPGLRDMAGALLLARSQPLRQGDVIQLAVFPGEWMYLVRAKVEGREKLTWHGEERPVIRVSLEIDYINKDYSLRPHRKFQRGTVWVSDDQTRLPLRVEVKVFIGHIFAELESIRTGE